MQSICSAKEKITDNRVPFCGSISLRIGAAALMTSLILQDPSTASEGGSAGLMLCAHAVIPSLFPFLILSPMLAAGIGIMITRLCRGRVGVRHTSLITAFVIGMLAGFPIGALTLLSFCAQGTITREDAARFLGVCTGASPAFLIGYFGQALWGNHTLGWFAWGIQSVVCLIGFSVLLFRIGSEECFCGRSEEIKIPALSVCLRDAVPRMLQICGAVIAFSVIRAFFCRWLDGADAVLLCGLAEMTGGLCDAAALAGQGGVTDGTALVLSAAVIGFGGCCVGMQITDAASASGVPMQRYWIQRTLMGLAGAFIGMIGCRLFGLI